LGRSGRGRIGATISGDGVVINGILTDEKTDAICDDDISSISLEGDA